MFSLRALAGGRAGLLFSSIAIACPAAVFAGADDVLVLKNGDRITGEISQVWDAEVTIEPDYASDEFNVDMEAIAYIKSDRDFELELEDGRSVTGKLAGADEQGRQLIVVQGQRSAVPLSQLEELEEPEEYFDWETNINLAVSIDKGNTDKEDLKISGDTAIKLGDHRHIGYIEFIREEQDGVDTKKQDFYRYDYNWLFDDPWFLAGLASYERDPIRDLDHRYTAGAGIGRDIWNTPRLLLNFQFGLGWQTEEIGGDQNDSTIAFWLLRYRQDFFDTDFELYHNDSITDTLTGRDNTIYKTTTGLRYDINDTLDTFFEVIYDYETDPAPGFDKEDLSILFGLSAEFE